MFKRIPLRWVLTIPVVLLGVAVCLRMGFWQLDRLNWQREFNTRVIAQVYRPILDLNQPLPDEPLTNMEYRQVTATGMYDFDNQVLLRNQVWNDRPGFSLITPLKIQDSSYTIIVQRGWFPLDQVGNLSLYDEPGLQTITGVLRRAMTEPDFGGIPDPTLAPSETRFIAWNIINLERLQEQIDYPILPVYIQQAPGDDQDHPPYRSLTPVDISEGAHLGYAIQWFSFAAVLLFGYPFYVRYQLKRRRSLDVQ